MGRWESIWLRLKAPRWGKEKPVEFWQCDQLKTERFPNNDEFAPWSTSQILGFCETLRRSQEIYRWHSNISCPAQKQSLAGSWKPDINSVFLYICRNFKLCRVGAEALNSKSTKSRTNSCVNFRDEEMRLTLIKSKPKKSQGTGMNQRWTKFYQYYMQWKTGWVNLRIS